MRWNQGTVDKCRYSEEVPARSRLNVEKGKNVELEWQSVAPESDTEDMADSNPATGKALPNEYISVADHDWPDALNADSFIPAPQLYPESPVFNQPGPGEWSDTLPSVFYEDSFSQPIPSAPGPTDSPVFVSPSGFLVGGDNDFGKLPFAAERNPNPSVRSPTTSGKYGSTSRRSRTVDIRPTPVGPFPHNDVPPSYV
ncbi:hypothetical protein FRC12_010293 [Ceratobasidium sp. 428]|nr:hypothetical protein FRC12_010293 [Ceratobasidium sp. 428]